MEGYQKTVRLLASGSGFYAMVKFKQRLEGKIVVRFLDYFLVADGGEALKKLSESNIICKKKSRYNF